MIRFLIDWLFGWANLDVRIELDTDDCPGEYHSDVPPCEVPNAREIGNAWMWEERNGIDKSRLN